MSFWNSRYVKKTKKEHTCIYCGCKMPAGSSCWHETGIYEGDFNDYRLCGRCRYVLNDYRDEFCPDGEINDLFDDFANAGLLDCPKCGKANMRKYEWTDAARQQMAIECDNCGHIYTADLSIEGIDKVLSPEAEVQEP